MSIMRPLILSMLLLALVAGGLPVSESLARWSSRPSVSRSKGKHVRHRRSRAWWKRRRAWLKRRRARAALRRSQTEAAAVAASVPRRKRNTASNSKSYTDSNTSMNSNVSFSMPVDDSAPARRAPARGARLPVSSKTGTDKSVLARVASAPRVPYDLTLPGSWSSATGNGSEMKFVVRSVDGQSAGTASLAPVVLGVTDVPPTPRMKTLGGVPLSILRRTVIDRMAAEGGWVVNDMEREIHGRRVFIVLARTGAAAGAPEQTLTFYFTEVDGRIYRLATHTPVGLAEPVASASEKIVSTFRVSNGGDANVAVKTPR